MRAHRKPLTGEARLKATARSYAKVYLKRGLLARWACEECGNQEVQMHHADYSKPLEISWFCREHHLALHRKQLA
jgi:hypothetical protein